jgi:hypothetical protein
MAKVVVARGYIFDEHMSCQIHGSFPRSAAGGLIPVLLADSQVPGARLREQPSYSLAVILTLPLPSGRCGRIFSTLDRSVRAKNLPSALTEAALYGSRRT